MEVILLPKFEELAREFEFLAQLVEMIGDNPFKARAYRFAAAKMRERGGEDVTEDAISRLSKEKGVGKAIVEKSRQFLHTGRIEKIEELKSQIPLPLFYLAKKPSIPGRELHRLYCDLKELPPGEIVAVLKEQATELGLENDFFALLEEKISSSN
ncbi:MAG TPA: hypothetical protein DHV12_10095 [Thermotogae bacterium]|nr:hypothetical protein [Thermotogota bacterium]